MLHDISAEEVSRIAKLQQRAISENRSMVNKIAVAFDKACTDNPRCREYNDDCEGCPVERNYMIVMDNLRQAGIENYLKNRR